MRGNVPSNSQPECTVDLDFVFSGNTQELWACTVVQGAWNRWREHMGMLLLQYGLADLAGNPESVCVTPPFTNVLGFCLWAVVHSMVCMH